MTLEPINANIRMCRRCGALYGESTRPTVSRECACGGEIVLVGTVVVTPPEGGSPVE